MRFLHVLDSRAASPTFSHPDVWENKVQDKLLSSLFFLRGRTLNYVEAIKLILKYTINIKKCLLPTYIRGTCTVYLPVKNLFIFKKERRGFFLALLCWKPFGNTGSLDVPFLLSPSSGLSGRRVVLLVRLRRGLRRGHLRPLPPGDPPGGQRGPRLPADGGEAPVSRAPLLQGAPAPGQRRRAGRDGHPAAWEVRQEAEPERIRRQVQPQVLQEEGGPVPVSGERRSLSKRVSVSKCLIFFLSLSLSGTAWCSRWRRPPSPARGTRTPARSAEVGRN